VYDTCHRYSSITQLKIINNGYSGSLLYNQRDSYNKKTFLSFSLQRRLIISRRAKKLSEGFMRFSNEIIAFVKKCSGENCQKLCSGEKWPAGAVARHIGAGHYSAQGLAKTIVDGKQVPELNIFPI